MKNISLKVLLGLFFISQTIIAQPVDPPADPDPLPAPINQWLCLLIILGIAYGFQIIKKNRIISN